MMHLWYLQRKISRRELKPGEYWAMIVLALDQNAARFLASERKGIEQYTVWLDSEQSTCIRENETHPHVVTRY